MTVSTLPMRRRGTLAPVDPNELRGDELARWLDAVADRAARELPGSPQSRAYATAPEQVVDLWGGLDAGLVVVTIHGGYFAAEYDRSGIEPLCRRLASEGHGVANVEYRRTGSVTDPLDSVSDVRAAIRSVRAWCPSARLVLVGHSAGGYLALTGSTERGVCGALALAPATLLRAIADGGYDDGALQRWVGAAPVTDPPAWERLAPERVGLGTAPVRVLHGRLDTVVPAEHSVRWVGERVAAGADLSLGLLERIGHYEFLDPASSAADAVVAAVHRLARID